LSLDAGLRLTLEFATGRGRWSWKPSPVLSGCARGITARRGHGGDDAESDIAGALGAGLAAAVLVRTGKYRAGDETRFSPRPTTTVADLSAAVDWIVAQRGP
jgi:ribonucleotide monophosphatase NagD (HAD superfamily)